MTNIVVLDEAVCKRIKPSPHFLLTTPIAYILQERNAGACSVYNFSGRLGYQDSGYYVSLIASARKDKIYPSPQIIQDLKGARIRKIISEELYNQFQSHFRTLKGDEFELTVVLGRNLAQKYNTISWEFFRILQAPLFRVTFRRAKTWNIKSIQILSPDDLSPDMFDFFCERLESYFENYSVIRKSKRVTRYDLAILYNSEEKSPPSDKRALQKFVRAAHDLGIGAYLVENRERINIPEFDALFIRETTSVPHHTYRLARWAEREKLFVIDDPDSIMKCGNKIFLEQMMDRLRIRRPQSMVVDRRLLAKRHEEITYPCILKSPDSAFSMGVHKIKDAQALRDFADRAFRETDLLLIQEFLPTDFDWRVGILGGEVLFVCKYYMATDHWQIVNHAKKGKGHEGAHESIPVEKADPKLLQLALKAAKHIGNGLYGVDIKQKGDKYYLIEVNDNPNVNTGIEDQILGDELYHKIMKHFLSGIEKVRGIKEAA